MESIGTYLKKMSHLSEGVVELSIVIITNHGKGDFVLPAHKKDALSLVTLKKRYRQSFQKKSPYFQISEKKLFMTSVEFRWLLDGP